jgi:hypothetical protein
MVQPKVEDPLVLLNCEKKWKLNSRLFFTIKCLAYQWLIKMCSIQYEISTKIWTLVKNGSVVVRAWKISFVCFLTNSTLELT